MAAREPDNNVPSSLEVESHAVTVAKTEDQIAVVVDGNVVAKIETANDDTSELIQQSIRLLESMGLDFLAELLEENFES